MYIDTHCHIDFPVFDEDRHIILEKCRSLSVMQIIVPGVTREQWARQAEVCSHYPGMLAPAYGLHPCFCHLHQDADLEQLETCLNHSNPVAVGEIGLDFYIQDFDATKQTWLFREQVKLAKQFRLPIIVHCRKAHDQCLKVIRETGFHQGGFIHAYSGSLQQAQRYLDYGFKLGIGGAATYDRAQKLHKILKTLPLDSFVLETDAPDIPPSFARNQLNSPLNLPEIARIAAGYKGVSQEDFARHTTQNAQSVIETSDLNGQA